MLNLKHCLFAIATGGLAWTSSTAVATVVFTTGASSNFSATTGSTVAVPIYLRETGGNEITAGGGLLSAGFGVQHLSGVNDDAVIGGSNLDGNGDPFGGYVANLAANAFLETVDGSFTDTSAALYEDVFSDTAGNPSNSPVLPTSGLLLLGWVNVQAASTAGVVSTFSMGDFDSNSANIQTLTNSFVGLDGTIGAANFTVTAVPEPATCSLLAAACFGLAMRKRNKI